MLALLAWLFLALAVQDEAEAVPLPEDLAFVYKEIRDASIAGDLERARSGLAAIFEEGLFDALLEEDLDVALAGIEALDPAAESLGVVDVQLRLRRARVELLAEAVDGDHPDLLRARHLLALALKRSGDLRGAHELELAIVETRERSLPPEHGDLLSAKQNLASTLYELGDYRGAHELLASILEVRERMLSEDDPDLLTARGNVAVTLKSLGDLEAALELEESIYAVRARTLPESDPDRLLTEGNLAATLYALGDFERAHELLLHAYETHARTLPPEHPTVLRAKQNLAGSTKQIGDLEGALALEEELLEVRERTLPADHPDLLRARGNLADTCHRLGDLDRALELQSVVLAGLERTLPAGHEEILRARRNLAATVGDLGDHARARATLEEILRGYSELFAPDHPAVLETEQVLGATLCELGEFERAHALYENVYATRARRLEGDNPELLTAKTNLAVTRKALGDLEGAAILEEAVLEALAGSLGPSHPDRLRAQQNLAVTLRELGESERASLLLADVCTRLEEDLGPVHPEVLRAKGNLAIVLRETGDVEGALEINTAVLAARREVLPAGHPDVLVAQGNLASVLFRKGEHERALELFEEVLAARASALPPYHDLVLSARIAVAEVRAGTGDAEGALRETRALLAGQVALAEVLYVEAARPARAAARRELDRLARALDLSRRLASTGASLEADGLASLENLRAASTAWSEMATAARHDPELAALREEVARARRAVNQLVLEAPPFPEDVERWRGEIAERTEVRDRLEGELRAALAREVPPVEVDAPSIAGALSPGAAWVGYFRPRGEQDALLAFVVSPDGDVARVDLGPADDIESLVTGWRDLVGRPLEARGLGGGEAKGEDGDELDAAGRALRAWVLDPCLAVLETPPDILHVVLDDVLHLVPIDALPADDGIPLGGRLAVRVETSARRLVGANRAVRGTGGFLGVGGVDYEAIAPGAPSTDGERGIGSASTAVQRFPALAGTGPEVEALGSLYEAGTGAPPELLEGRQASARALRDRVASARYLHVATHGWFAPESYRSAVEVRAGEQRTLFDRADETVRGFAPETLCGLALAGANTSTDGILTAEELSTFDLSNCELAVLSACETNVGLQRSGQGIQSLQSALHAAGARSAITSLWRVDDAATRRLMELFYTKLWRDGLGKADALWEAKMALRDEGHPIRDWAGWVLTGDPN